MIYTREDLFKAKIFYIISDHQKNCGVGAPFRDSSHTASSPGGR